MRLSHSDTFESIDPPEQDCARTLAFRDRAVECRVVFGPRAPQLCAQKEADMSKRYEPKNFPRLKGLSGISDSLLQDHFKLYEGYVKNVNELNSQLEQILKDGKAKGTNPAFAELTRWLGFEYGGLVLH